MIVSDMQRMHPSEAPSGVVDTCTIQSEEVAALEPSFSENPSFDFGNLLDVK